MRPLSFLLSLSLLFSVSAAAAAEKPAPRITHSDVATPAGPGALGAALTTAADGTLWLMWFEHAAEPGLPTLRFSTFDATAQRWSAARIIVSGRDALPSSPDFPQFVIDDRGHATAVWTVGSQHERLTTTSTDRGATWSPPIKAYGTGTEKLSFVRLADGRILAAWLSNDVITTGPKLRKLYARLLGDPSTAPATLIDPSVSENSALALTAFPDGGALLAYRGRAEGEVRDIRTARFRGNAWDESRPLNNDDWRIAACPVNGPRLASDGGRVSAVWFTAADNDPRVLASYSPDAGARFLLPLRLDNGRPAGQPDTLILRDGAILATWLETDGSLWLRRISPDFSADDPVALAPAGTVSTKTHPRLALLRDYTGGTESAQLLVAFTTATGLRTLHITVPEGELLTAKGNCDCAPTPEQLMGYAARGAVAAISTERGTIHLVHEEFPGLLFAGTHEFRADPSVLSAVQLGRRLFGRIEKRSGQWWLYDVRLAQSP